MRPVQRVYLYVAALVSLLIMLLSLTQASATLIGLALPVTTSPDATGTVQPNLITLWLGLALCAGLSWAIHWYLANRTARTLTMTGAAERGETIRKAYLYIGQFSALSVFLAEAVQALYSILLVLLGDQPASWASWLAKPLSSAVSTTIALGFWFYLHRVARQDGDLGNEPGAGASWRRAYYYMSAGMSTLIGGVASAEFLRAFLRMIGGIYYFGLTAADAHAWRVPVGISLAAAACGLPVAFLAWQRANRVAVEPPLRLRAQGKLTLGPNAAEETIEELNALSRKVLLYAGMAAGTAIMLVALTILIWQGLMVLFGQAATDLRTQWEGMLSPAIAYLPLGVILSSICGWMVRRDMTWAPEHRNAAILRRLYFYLLSGIGLAAFWYGLQLLLILGILLMLGVWPLAVLFAPKPREFFGLAAALALMGSATWWKHWRFQQTLARDRGPAGHDERSSRLRRLYLYGAVIAAAVVAVVTLVSVISQAPAWLFGPTATDAFAQSLAELGAGIVLALCCWIGHGIVLRGDDRLRAKYEAQHQGMAQVVDSQPAESRHPLPVAPADAAPTADAVSEDEKRQMAEAELFRQAAPLSTPRVPSLPARNDDQQPVTGADRRPSGAPAGIVAVVDGADGSVGAALLAALKSALPDATLWPVGLNAEACTAMSDALGGPSLVQIPADALARISVIAGPSDIVAPGGINGEVPLELASALAGSAAHKVLLPPRDPGLRWVAAPDWPRERWIEYAVAEIAQALGA